MRGHKGSKTANTLQITNRISRYYKNFNDTKSKFRQSWVQAESAQKLLFFSFWWQFLDRNFRRRTWRILTPPIFTLYFHLSLSLSHTLTHSHTQLLPLSRSLSPFQGFTTSNDKFSPCWVFLRVAQEEKISSLSLRFSFFNDFFQWLPTFNIPGFCLCLNKSPLGGCKEWTFNKRLEWTEILNFFGLKKSFFRVEKIFFSQQILTWVSFSFSWLNRSKILTLFQSILQLLCLITKDLVTLLN